jgi:VWFA-related protein
MRRAVWILAAVFMAAAVCAPMSAPRAQKRTDAGAARADVRRDVRSVTIPVTVRLPERQEQSELHYLEALQIFEDGDRQEILATRGAGRSPMTVAVLIQDDLASIVSNEIKGIADFVRRLPPGSRVMVGYLRTGTLQVRQKFTSDTERAAKSLRIPVSSSAVAPFNPFAQTRDALKRFDSQPVGRRAVLLLSDGVDTSRGFENSSPGTGFDLQRAINEAQRLGVAIYSIYEPTAGTANFSLAGNGQGSLNRLSEETGGRAFFQGTGAPVSLDRFLRDIDALLSRQFALTYLSTHPDKGFHKVRVVADVGGGELYYPNGYTR